MKYYLGELWSFRWVLKRLFLRSLRTKFVGHFLGPVWLVLNPLILFSVYAFAFSRVGGGGEFHFQTAFQKIIPAYFLFLLFIETVNLSGNAIIGNTSFVKRVVFPSEILVINVCLLSIFNFCLYFLFLMGIDLVLFQELPMNHLMLPILAIPVCIYSFGIALFLSSFAVFFRDILNIIPYLGTLLLFLTPIFYESQTVPTILQLFYKVFPVAMMVQLVKGQDLSLLDVWGKSMIVALITVVVSGYIFKKWKTIFPEVL